MVILRLAIIQNCLGKRSKTLISFQVHSGPKQGPIQELLGKISLLKNGNKWYKMNLT